MLSCDDVIKNSLQAKSKSLPNLNFKLQCVVGRLQFDFRLFHSRSLLEVAFDLKLVTLQLVQRRLKLLNELRVLADFIALAV